MVTVRSAQFPSDGQALADLCWGYRALLEEQTRETPELVKKYYHIDTYGALLTDLPRIHARPTGDIVIAELDGPAVGCAMYYPLATPGTCEIKRIFVTETARGHGAGRALIKDAMKRARADGYARMVLDTNYVLKAAIGLYEALGFTACDPFYEVDPQFARVLRFYDIAL